MFHVNKWGTMFMCFRVTYSIPKKSLVQFGSFVTKTFQGAKAWIKLKLNSSSIKFCWQNEFSRKVSSSLSILFHIISIVPKVLPLALRVLCVGHVVSLMSSLSAKPICSLWSLGCSITNRFIVSVSIDQCFFVHPAVKCIFFQLIVMCLSRRIVSKVVHRNHGACFCLPWHLCILRSNSQRAPKFQALDFVLDYVLFWGSGHLPHTYLYYE